MTDNSIHMKIDHINISAPRDVLDKDKDFLCNVLNLTEGFRPNISGFGYWLYSGEDALFHLSESDRHTNSENPYFIDHVALQMSGLDDFVNKLEDEGIKYHRMYQAQTYVTQIFMALPSGVKIEIDFRDEPKTST